MSLSHQPWPIPEKAKRGHWSEVRLLDGEITKSGKLVNVHQSNLGGTPRALVMGEGASQMLRKRCYKLGGVGRDR